MTDDARLLRYARVIAAIAYLLGGAAVILTAVSMDTPHPALMAWLLAVSATFIAVSTVAKRFREHIPDRVLLKPPRFRDLWPRGFTSAPLYTTTALIALYAGVNTLTSIMTGAFPGAVLAASITIVSYTLHRLVPEVLIATRTQTRSEHTGQ